MAKTGKTIGWILVILGVYGFLAMLVDSINWIPSILTGWVGWIVSLVIFAIGAWMAFK